MNIIDITKKISQSSQNGIICTIVKVEGTASRQPGSKMIVWQDGTTNGTIGGGEFEHEMKSKALELLLSTKTNNLFEYNKFDKNCNVTKKIDIFFEKIDTKTTILIYGAGYVGAAIAELGVWSGFDIIIGDDRQEIINNLSPIIQPYARLMNINDFSKKVIELKNNKMVICATRSAEIDIKILSELSDHNLEYIGLLGSSKRWNHTKNVLTENNTPTQLLKKVHSPIGLSINAQTPNEIAISVIAQLIKYNKTD